LEIELEILGWEPAFCGGAILQFDGRNQQVGPLEYDIFAMKLAILLEQEFLEIFANRTETSDLMEHEGSPQTRDLVGHVQGVVSIRFEGKPAQEPARVRRDIGIDEFVQVMEHHLDEKEDEVSVRFTSTKSNTILQFVNRGMRCQKEVSESVRIKTPLVSRSTDRPIPPSARDLVP
jgi:hypothetical protein